MVCLHNGKIHIKLVTFREQKKPFFLKNTPTYHAFHHSVNNPVFNDIHGPIDYASLAFDWLLDKCEGTKNYHFKTICYKNVFMDK
jgi:hypothetical protein